MCKLTSDIIEVLKSVGDRCCSFHFDSRQIHYCSYSAGLLVVVVVVIDYMVDKKVLDVVSVDNVSHNCSD